MGTNSRFHLTFPNHQRVITQQASLIPTWVGGWGREGLGLASRCLFPTLLDNKAPLFSDVCCRLCQNVPETKRQHQSSLSKACHTQTATSGGQAREGSQGHRASFLEFSVLCSREHLSHRESGKWWPSLTMCHQHRPVRAGPSLVREGRGRLRCLPRVWI